VGEGKGGVWKQRARESLRVWRNWKRGEYGEEKMSGHRSSIYALQLAKERRDVLVSASADRLIKGALRLGRGARPFLAYPYIT
jgi:hypothetical protein